MSETITPEVSPEGPVTEPPDGLAAPVTTAGEAAVTDAAPEPEDEPARRPLTIAANRAPVRLVDGRWELSPGGLVRAMVPVMRAWKGTWVGWSGIDSNVTEDEQAGPMAFEDLRLVDVPLTPEDLDEYYRQVANGVLWPLFHDGVRHPSYDDAPWDTYVSVNRRFARIIDAETPEGGSVWLHDYHLLLVPGLLRARRPDLRIGLFIHIPVPPVELFATLPWRDEIATSLRRADLIGTQTEPDAEHLRQCIAFSGHASGPVETSGERTGETTGETASASGDTAERAEVDAFPISIESGRYRSMARDAEERGDVDRARRDLGNGRRIFLGVERLDYTKGIDQRLKALELAIEAGRLDTDEFCFVQVAVPSRETVAEYVEMSERVDSIIGRINGVHGTARGPVIHYYKRNMSEEELIQLYRAADVMVVTPLRDGMNLVAKEFVATRYDGTGELILSEFAGAARELDEAILVNPHDVPGIADALVEALERARRGGPTDTMRRMHEHVIEHDVHRWSGSFMRRLAGASPDGGDGGSSAPGAGPREAPVRSR